jgi:hypothetical protein
MVKHFTHDEADAGSNPADISSITLNYFILIIYEYIIQFYIENSNDGI